MAAKVDDAKTLEEVAAEVEDAKTLEEVEDEAPDVLATVHPRSTNTQGA